MPRRAAPLGLRTRRDLWFFTGTGVVIALLLVVGSWRFAYAVHDEGVDARLARYNVIIVKHARRTGLPAEFITAVIRAESGGRPRAVSKKNAKGLMQITQAAHADALKMLGIPRGDLFDPDYNLLIGTTYLKHLFDQFNGDLHLVVAAYHMGPTRVRRIKRSHPNLSSPELVRRHAGPATRAYVANVLTPK